MADATDLHVFANNGPLRSRELFVSCDKNIIRIPFRNLKRGLYNVWVSFRLNGRLVSLSYNNAFSIVEWNNAHTNWEKYKQGSELAVESGFYISGNINSGDWNQLWNEMSQFEDLKQECRDAAANANRAAEYAKQEGEEAEKQAGYAKEQGGLAEKVVQRADTAAKDAEDAAKEAEKQAKDAMQAAKDAGDAKSQIETDYASVKAGLQAAYAQTSSALEADYEQKINALNAEYSETERALSADYAQKKAQLDADYLSAKQSLDSRMSAIETQYSTDKAGWQKQVDDFLADCQRIFDSKEAERDAAMATIEQEAQKLNDLSQQISDLDKSIFDEPHDFAAELLASGIIVSSASGASVRVDGNKLYYSCPNRVSSWFGFSNAILNKDTRYHVELVPTDITKIVKASKVAFLSGTSSGYVVSNFTQDEDKLVYTGRLNDDPTQGRQTSISLDGNYTYEDFEFTLKVVKEGAEKSLKEGIVSEESLEPTLKGKVQGITPSINGDSNLFIGKNAGINTQESASGDDGRWNFAAGVNAMKDNTTGDHCTAVGFQAMQKNTTGDGNTGIGEDALYENTTGTSNTSVGTHNMQNCKGSQNTSVGASGLQNLTTGAFNTQIGGYNGGSNITTGSRNTLVGAGANVYSSMGAINDAIVIGMTSANKDGQIIIGSSNNVEFVIRLNVGKIKLIFNSDHTVNWEIIE